MWRLKSKLPARVLRSASPANLRQVCLALSCDQVEVSSLPSSPLRQTIIRIYDLPPPLHVECTELPPHFLEFCSACPQKREGRALAALGSYALRALPSDPGAALVRESPHSTAAQRRWKSPQRTDTLLPPFFWTPHTSVPSSLPLHDLSPVRSPTSLPDLVFVLKFTLWSVLSLL